jgi:ergothioneine biosynthesis protein EgtB
MTESLCAPLEAEDFVMQPMPEVSPPKWHLAHTTWFFETFVLGPNAPGYKPFHPSFCYLFNSYYNAVGDRLPRPRRGLMTRPSLEQVHAYRAAVDRAMAAYLDTAGESLAADVATVITLGIHHEQQHQELILTDIKHALSLNPLRPAYRDDLTVPSWETRPAAWIASPGGLHEIGHDGSRFAFDNEGPRHRVHLEPFRVASRLSTVGEYLAFMGDSGYARPELWLSDGWAAVQAQRWEAPLYWERDGAGWRAFTLGGMRPLNEAEPVCHVSYYEADAFARWAGARLATEAEWEVAAGEAEVMGNLLDESCLHPRAAGQGAGPTQTFGDVWEWTQSPYTPYPGSRAAAGALGEYNAKFMCNQLVLRGGSCITPASHIRPTYRNFFPPEARWQFSGIRLASDS